MRTALRAWVRRVWERATGRRSRRVIGILVLLVAAFTWWCDHTVRSRAAGHVFSTVEAVPWNEVGLVLGTSQWMRGGGPNPYFAHRIAAAAELYHAGKVGHLLVSGDNSTRWYNEPIMMRRALIAAGVDSARITMDHAGLRTFDSVVRAREVFGQRRFTVISQRFHNERAVFIARRMGIDAVGYNARDVPGRHGMRTRMREKAARVKLFIDLMLGTKPRHLGEPVRIGEGKQADTRSRGVSPNRP